jgi:glycosyltransferase involved in cell wall biosynthesis
MINISFFVYSLNFGGAEKVLIELLKYLSRNEFRTHVVVRKKEGELLAEVPKDVILSKFPEAFKLWNPVVFRKAIKNYVVSNNISIVCCFGPELSVMSLLSGLKKHAKIIITEHTIPSKGFSNSLSGRVRKALIRIFYRYADRIIAVSKAVKNDLSNHFSVPEHLITVINNPVDLSKKEFFDCKQTLHERNADVPSIVSCGRLIKLKNFDRLLYAFKNVLARKPCRLIIVGDGEERQRLYDLAVELGIAANVEFTGYRRDAHRLYSNADFFVLNSSFEGFGNVIVEAMAYGLPVISTKCGGPEDIIIQGNNGLLIPIHDTEALEKAMVLLLTDKPLRDKLATNAKKSAEAFSSKVIVEKYEAEFKSTHTKKMKLLVLPAITKNQFYASSNERLYFNAWPLGSYDLTTVGAFKYTWTKMLFAKHLKIYPFQFLHAVLLMVLKKHDVVIAFGSQSGMPISLFKSIFKIKNPPVIVFDVEKLGRKEKGLSLKLVRKACDGIDLLLYYSRFQEEYYRTFIPELAGKTRFLHLGIPPVEKAFPWEESDKENYVVVLGTPQTSRVQRKLRDWETLITASQKFPSELRLRIYGKQQFNSADIGQAMVPASLVLFPYTPKKALSPIIERSRFAILPLWETGSAQGQLTLLYLMSLGKAVIVGKIKGIEDYVIDGKTAFYYEPGNSTDLQEKALYLYNNPLIVSQIGHQAYHAVRNHFNISIIGEKMFRLISELRSEKPHIG